MLLVIMHSRMIDNFIEVHAESAEAHTAMEGISSVEVCGDLPFHLLGALL